MAEHSEDVRADVARIRMVVRQEWALLGYHIEGLYGRFPDNSLESQYVPALRALAKILKEGQGGGAN